MSWFIDILKNIFGSGAEERKEIPRNQSQSDHDYHRVRNVGYGASLINQSSFTQTTSSSNVHRNQYDNSSRSFSYPNREIDNYSVPIRPGLKSSNSAADFAYRKENPIDASKSALASSEKPVLVTKESTSQTNNLLKKPCEFALQQKGVNLSSSNGSVSQCNIPNRTTNKLTDQKLNSHATDASSASSSFNPLQSSSRLPPFPGSSELFPSSSKTEKLVSSREKDPSQFSPTPSKIHSAKPPPISAKPTLSLASSSSMCQQKKTNYFWLEKSASSTYVFPDDIKSSIERDIVPGVLKMPLSMSTYKDYFHSLLYAEDYYLEKWDGFEVKSVTLELHEASIYKRKGKSKCFNEADEKDEKIFVAFEIDKIPERRPFLLSRDFVSVQPSSRKIKPFQGVIYHVVKSNLVLAEFGENFYSQHHPACEYDVKFSFNRVCLKRAHQAIAAASDLLYRNFLFPGFAPIHDHELPSAHNFPNYRYQKDAFAIQQILRLQGGPPYLVEGPISVVERKRLSRTGVVIVEAVLRLCRTSPSNRIVLCAPLNNTCDVIMRALKKEMAESDMFRANAAFREVDGVPVDILPSCLYEREMEFFACPSLEELHKYKVILSTYMSSFRLYEQGIKAGHFSHIFLVDNSSVTEPETMVPLANFANAETVVVATGTQRNRSGWIRSKIARQNGLMTSYFERLHESVLYKNLDPRVISQLDD